VHAWLRSVADRLSASTGVDRDELELSPAEIEALLDLAGTAAHETGARTNAPLTCFLVGLARGRTGAPLAALIDSAAAGAPGEVGGGGEQQSSEKPL